MKVDRKDLEEGKYDEEEIDLFLSTCLQTV